MRRRGTDIAPARLVDARRNSRSSSTAADDRVWQQALSAVARNAVAVPVVLGFVTLGVGVVAARSVYALARRSVRRPSGARRRRSKVRVHPAVPSQPAGD
jgi:hypothetical protein